MNKFLIVLILLFFSSRNIYSQETWNVLLGKKTYVNINHVTHYQYIPDGHIAVLPDGNGQYMMFWSEFENSRTVGDTQFPEDQKTMEPANVVFGGRAGDAGPSNGVNDGGSWLMSVFRHNGDTLIGYYHGESHWYPRNGDFTAWKSICVAYSYDNGFTWDDQGNIVTSNKPKPSIRTWGGAGDCCVVWDSVNSRWNCYHQEHNIRLAVSYDPLGAPGTWKKYHNGEFEEEGLGGNSSPLSGLTNSPGANPSVHWNTYYNKWVMTHHGWDGGIYISLSSDGVNWESPKKIISKQGGNRWYPTIIGETDTKAGKLARLYYAEFGSGRKMAARDILFDTIAYNYGNLPDPWKAESVGSYSFEGKAGIANDVIRISGTTNYLFGKYDGFFYMHQSVKKNGAISSLLTSQTETNNRGYSGIMLRSSISSGSKFVSIGRKSKTDTLIINYRDDDQISKVEAISSQHDWFKIQKGESGVDVLTSKDGTAWESVYSVDVELSEEFMAGIYSTSHNESNFCTATFENTLVDFIGVNAEKAGYDLLRIYPNPASSKLHIEAKYDADLFSYSIIDTYGKIYKKGALNGKFSELNIAELPPKMYILKIVDENAYTSTHKLLIE